MSTPPRLDPSFELTPNPDGRRRRTGRRAPRFQPNHAAQLDPMLGCPELQVPKDHLARQVLDWVAELDTPVLLQGYSSLGRRGFDPREKLAVWLYASLIGVHHASKVAERMKTDAAFRLLSGSHEYSATTLREFRREHGEFFEAAVAQTVALAAQAGHLDPQQGAVDSMRLRAHASPASVRTVLRSKQRLEELGATDVSELSEEELATHQAKVSKHEQALQRAKSEERSNFSVTNEWAGLIKFPHGAALPGHRVSVAAFGVQLRLIVTLLITAKGQDYGQLEQLARDTRDRLLKAGVVLHEPIQIAADAGYLSSSDLQFAEANRSWVDVLIHESAKAKAATTFGRDNFVIRDDGSATCPAGKAMNGPYATPEGRRRWTGVDCADCPLRSNCTTGRTRTLTQDPQLERARTAMRERMAEAGAKERYNQRIATVEPVFSGLEEMMGYRRASSRFAKTIHAEIQLKVLAYNLSRLAVARRGHSRLLVARFAMCLDGAHIRVLAAWTTWATDSPEDENCVSRPTRLETRLLRPILL